MTYTLHRVGRRHLKQLNGFRIHGNPQAASMPTSLKSSSSWSYGRGTRNHMRTVFLNGVRSFRTVRRQVSEMDELLPCPFCGGDAKLNGYMFNVWTVDCSSCEVHTRVDYHCSDPKAKAIETWNKRQSHSAGEQRG